MRKKQYIIDIISQYFTIHLHYGELIKTHIPTVQETVALDAGTTEKKGLKKKGLKKEISI